MRRRSLCIYPLDPLSAPPLSASIPFLLRLIPRSSARLARSGWAPRPWSASELLHAGYHDDSHGGNPGMRRSSPVAGVREIRRLPSPRTPPRRGTAWAPSPPTRSQNGLRTQQPDPPPPPSAARTACPSSRQTKEAEAMPAGRSGGQIKRMSHPWLCCSASCFSCASQTRRRLCHYPWTQHHH